jgi:hypothetical protein
MNPFDTPDRKTAQHPSSIDVAGSLYLRDAKGSLVPLTAVKAADLLMDETVRGILGQARDVSAQIAAFKVDVFERVSALQRFEVRSNVDPHAAARSIVTARHCASGAGRS